MIWVVAFMYVTGGLLLLSNSPGLRGGWGYLSTALWPVWPWLELLWSAVVWLVGEDKYHGLRGCRRYVNKEIRTFDGGRVGRGVFHIGRIGKMADPPWRATGLVLFGLWFVGSIAEKETP